MKHGLIDNIMIQMV